MTFFLQEWWDILKLYEKKNLYMAECAQQLTRNVNYEIPALKQQISRCQQTERVIMCTVRRGNSLWGVGGSQVLELNLKGQWINMLRWYGLINYLLTLT